MHGDATARATRARLDSSPDIDDDDAVDNTWTSIKSWSLSCLGSKITVYILAALPLTECNALLDLLAISALLLFVQCDAAD